MESDNGSSNNNKDIIVNQKRVIGSSSTLQSMNNDNDRNSNNKNNNVSQNHIMDTTSEGIDYISNLPEVILLYILSFLPFKEWFVVSLLSKRWKYLWTKISSINLDEIEVISNIIRKDTHCPTCSDILSNDSSPQCLYDSISAAKRKFVEFVDRTLLLHSGCTINNMRLSFLYDVYDGYTNRIDTWVRYALTSNIKELELKFFDAEYFNFFDEKGLVVKHTDPPQPYDLPRGFFAPKMLRFLSLTFCKLRASSFGVSNYLQLFHLKHVEVIDCSITDIASKCPMLKDFILECCYIPDGFLMSGSDIMVETLSIIHCTSEEMLRIDISIPKMVMLTLVGENLNCASIKKASNLEEARIALHSIKEHSLEGDALNSLLRCLVNCTDLTINTRCIQVVPVEIALPKQLSIELQKVTQLRLVVGITKKEMPRLSCIIRACPNLKSLTLELSGLLEIFEDYLPSIYNFDEISYWESQRLPFPCLQNSLKEMIVKKVLGRGKEVQIILFLLKNAKVLEKAEFCICKLDNRIRYNMQKIREFQHNLRELFEFIRETIQPRVEVHVESIANDIYPSYL